MIEFIESRRRYLGITIKDLCVSVGITEPTYYRFKQKKAISYINFLKILKALKINLNELEDITE